MGTDNTMSFLKTIRREVIETDIGQDCKSCGRTFDMWNGYSTWRGDKMIEWVCTKCYLKGIRLDAQLEVFDKARVVQ